MTAKTDKRKAGSKKRRQPGTAGMKSMDEKKKKIRELEKIAYDPYERIENPATEDWRKSYDALKELSALAPENGFYQNTLGYLCYYGRHTGGERRYEEARKWFEEGAARDVIESQYKLADMLMDGLGGPEDPDRALDLYLRMYLYCLIQFTDGIRESKFADTALRMGRIFHEGKHAQKDDLEALSFLLEAKYAIDCRKQFDHYGDSTVEKNILQLIRECEQPPEEVRKREQYVLGLGTVPRKILISSRDLMTIDMDVDDNGVARLEFRRKDRDGGKKRILWPVALAMKCFMTDFVVLYGADIRQIWSKTPGKQVVCDRYEADEEKELYQFYMGEEVVCKLQGGLFVLPMDEFMKTEMRDHPEAGSDISQ